MAVCPVPAHREGVSVCPNPWVEAGKASWVPAAAVPMYRALKRRNGSLGRGSSGLSWGMHLEASPRENSLLASHQLLHLSLSQYLQPLSPPEGLVLAWYQQNSLEKSQRPPVPSLSHHPGQVPVVSPSWTGLQSLGSLLVRASVLWHGWESCRRDCAPEMQTEAQV